MTQYMGQMNSWDIGLEPQHLHMTWNMMQALKNANFSMDSHTQHHVHLAELANDTLRQQEIFGTQRDLVSFLGAPGTSFCYPYVQTSAASEWIIAHSGFHAATLLSQVKQCTSNANMYELSRIGVDGADTITTFANKINSGTCP